jgi:hypothetical protein
LVFTEITRHIADRFNLKSDEALARIGTNVNMRHREILSSLGISQVAKGTSATATASIASRFLTFGPTPVAVVKVVAVYDASTGSYPPSVLDEVSKDQMLNEGLVSDPPSKYCIYTMGERSVTIQVNAIAGSAYVLTADVEGNTSQLSGADSPAFDEDYHDILVNMVTADELEKAEKYDKAAAKLKQADKRMGELRLHIAKSAYKELTQGGRNRSV